ncbi:MAG: AAA family ATPase [Nitrososphaerota archaeon]|nr:AAA family ATPase [Nitrososphaerota archaeon]
MSDSPGERRPLIREVILENFMSYDYGRIALRPGLNIILGPNGAGKSSILVGISVALGQGYTERSRRLSDLVKRGREIGRVTLLLDNTPRDGKRPLPFRSDLIHLSRYIRKDGTYWFELDFKEAVKAEVTETLSGLGLNPDNMLVIMQQGLGDAFSVVPPSEKLSMVEEAVGLAPYRRSLLEARERLEKIKSEEEERRKELEVASTGLARWKEEYEKYVKIKELRAQLSKLRVEEAWSRVAKAEAGLRSLEEGAKRLGEEVASLRSRLGEEASEGESLSARLEESLQRLLLAERDRERLRSEEKASEEAEQVRSEVERMVSALPDSERDVVTGAVRADRHDPGRFRAESGRMDGAVASGLADFRSGLEALIRSKERSAVLSYRISELEKQARQLERQLPEAEKELRAALGVAEPMGARPEVLRSLSDVQAEVRLTDVQLKGLGAVADEAETMYTDYRSRIDQVSSKLKELDENKAATLREVEDRLRAWKARIEKFVQELNGRFAEILTMVGGNGRVGLVNTDNPLEAGLEISVSFRGDQLVPLDAFVQSGGERSSAVTALLLSLQGHVLSPFRAVDEFDVHMDRMNRQLFIKAVYDIFRNDRGTQYLIITPVEPEVYDREANYIMVHKVSASSSARAVAKIG